MNIRQPKNNKYFLGKYTDPGAFKGWFVGSFFNDKHPCKTDKIEVLYKEHITGDTQKPHYHIDGMTGSGKTTVSKPQK